MHKVLPVFLLLLSLVGCTLPAAQPFAALDNMPEIATRTPTTDAAQLVNNSTHPPTTESHTAHCSVTARAWVNLRSDAGTFAPGVGVLAHGETLTMTGPQIGAWVEVETRAGLRGWVNSKYCK